jgi:hypothetical protein
MTDPSAAAGQPIATPAPAPEAPKKGKSGRKTLISIVSVVVAIVVAVGVKIAVGGLFHTTTVDDFQVGKCVDQYSTSATAQQTSVPKIVDCSKSSAKAKIVGVYDGKTAANAESSCPASADAYLQLNKSAGGTVLVCLAGL